MASTPEAQKKYRSSEKYKQTRALYVVSNADSIKEWHDNDKPNKALRAHSQRLKKEYGITVEDYNNMFTSQNGECKICQTHQKDLKKRLAVDHCHETGKVRGLLCQKCNLGIGHLNDSVSLLEKALSYLKEII